MEKLDYGKYQESIAKEFIVKKDRVRLLLGNKHWGEEGHYKEVLIMDYLRSVLPNNFSVGTGFVVNNGEISTQIDILIYKNDEISIFKSGDFVIVPASSVYGIIEVKSKIYPSNNTQGIRTIIDKSYNNGKLIFKNSFIKDGYRNKFLFNGIFAYDVSNLEKTIEKIKEKVFIDRNVANFNEENILRGIFPNNICIGSKCFLELIDDGKYNVWKAEKRDNNFAFVNFFSSLLSNLYMVDKTDGEITTDVYKFLFPQNRKKDGLIIV